MSGNDVNLKLIYSGDVGRAEIIKTLLQDEGIGCCYGNHNLSGILPEFTKEIFVDSGDFDRSVSIINNINLPE
jgi:hypothetical protein